MSTYSFFDVNASITGPGGSIPLGYGAGVSEEGITVEMMEDKDTMTIGADGTPQHSLHAGRGGTVTVRLLKSSPTNGLLSAMYDLQTISSALHGFNVVVINNAQSGDIITCTDVGFRKAPNVVYAKEGQFMEWPFNAGVVVSLLGTGLANSALLGAAVVGASLVA